MATTIFGWRSRFTDDTVLTVATAEAILEGKDYGPLYKAYFRRYPLAGFGKSFTLWAMGNSQEPYNS